MIIRQVEDVVEKCEKRFSLQLNAKMKFNLMMHLALMVRTNDTWCRRLSSPRRYQPAENQQQIVLSKYTNDFLYFGTVL